MKRIFYTIVLLFIFNVLQAQQAISILFVNDNKAFAPNTQTMVSALQQTGFTFSTFDAVAQMRSPVYNELKDYDLVIWYTSTDGVGLYFWNGNDQDNPHLMQYLNNGGKLVVMGNDFLYDRYMTPSTFSPGDFVYNYLGTMVYQAQSYGDDGGLGVQQLDLVGGHTITSLNPVQWIFSTLWWADACLPVPGAVPAYRMGPTSYVLSNYFASIYFQSGNFATLSMFFDPALINTDANRIQLLTQVINYFRNLVGLSHDRKPSNALSVWPLPASGWVRINLNEGGHNRILLTDATGRVIRKMELAEEQAEILLDLSHLAPGIYNLTVLPYSLSRKIVITR